VNTGRDVVLGLVAALLVVLLVPALLRVRLRRSRLRSEGPGAPLALWEELCDSARDLGLPFPAPAQTARQYAALLARYAELPGDPGSPLQALVAAYERSAYAGGASDTATAAARAALVEVRAFLAACVLRRERWRANVLPASSWRAIRTGGRAVLVRLHPGGSGNGLGRLGGFGGLLARWRHREA